MERKFYAARDLCDAQKHLKMFLTHTSIQCLSRRKMLSWHFVEEFPSKFAFLRKFSGSEIPTERISFLISCGELHTKLRNTKLLISSWFALKLKPSSTMWLQSTKSSWKLRRRLHFKTDLLRVVKKFEVNKRKQNSAVRLTTTHSKLPWLFSLQNST